MVPRLTMVTQDLLGGGVARVITTMANYWATKGWHVTLLTYDNGKQPPFYPLHSRIIHRSLNIGWHSSHLPEHIWHHLQRIWILRQAIRQSAPNFIISAMVGQNIHTLLATRGFHIPVLVTEHIDPRQHKTLSHIWILLRQWTYLWSQRVILLSEQYRDYFPRRVQSKCAVIPNPFVLPPREAVEGAPSSSKQHQYTIVSVGRLTRQKGYDLLFRAYARIAARHPDWSLTIWGEGPERAHLETLRSELGLVDRVDLPGATSDPFAKYQQADLFVMPSRFEGFPMVLGEAMACGLPVIAFDCAAGVRDIIRDGFDGVLVPPEDVEGLAAAIDRLMHNEHERQRLAARAPEVLERFGIDKVMGIWEQVIADARKAQGPIQGNRI